MPVRTAPIVSVGSLLARVTLATPSGLWELVGRSRAMARLATRGGELRLWWEGAAALLVLITTAALAAAAYLRTPSVFVAFLAVLLLADMVAYHARALLAVLVRRAVADRPQRGSGPAPPARRLRLSIFAVLNFFEAILLLGVLYERAGCVREPPPAGYQASLALATTLRVPETLGDCSSLIATQIALSLYFGVVVVGLVASMALNDRRA